MNATKEISLVHLKTPEGQNRFIAEASSLKDEESLHPYAEAKTPDNALGLLIRNYAKEFGLKIVYTGLSQKDVLDSVDYYSDPFKVDPTAPKIDPREWEKNPTGQPLSDEQIDYFSGKVEEFQVAVRNWIDSKKWDLTHNPQEVVDHLNLRDNTEVSAGYTTDLKGDQLHQIHAALTFFGMELGLSEIQYYHTVYALFEDDVRVNGFRSALRRLRNGLMFYLQNPAGPV